jgi:hypothetical protein
MERGALNAERARRPSVWWQAARPLCNKCKGCMDLASGSACWLMSRATRHATAAGLRPSGRHRTRPGHVPALDPHPCMSFWELRTRLHRGVVSLGGPDPSIHLGMYYLSLPHGAPSPSHVVGMAASLRMT